MDDSDGRSPLTGGSTATAEAIGHPTEPDDTEPPPPAEGGGEGGGTAGGTAVLLARLDDLTARLDAFHEQAAQREAIITRLFDDNQRLRSGEVRAALVPVIGDLIDLRDVLSREADHLGRAEAGGAVVLDSLVGQVERMLARYGVERIDAEVGDPFDGERHEATGVAPTGDRTLDLTVAVMTTPGFVDRESGRVLRPASAVFHRYKDEPVAVDQPVPHDEEQH